jgi:hypothetical protein
MKLYALDLPWKLLITGFLIVLSSGFVVAELYLKHTTEMADGKEGLSLNDITFTFHGDETKTTLKKQVLGGMRKYFAEGGDEKNLTPEDLKDIEAVVAWSDEGVKSGTVKEEGYWSKELKDKDKNPKSVYKILDNHGCYDCHSAESTMKGGKKDSPLDTFVGIKKFTTGVDKGVDEGRLLSLSHIHLLGMGMMFLLIGAAVACTVWPSWIRAALIVGGLSSILLDIFGWWGVKWYGAPVSIVVMISGVLMGVSFGGSVFVAMYDLWLRKPTATQTQSGTAVSSTPGAAPVIMADSRRS